MFLKNTSEFQCGLRTKRETLTIYPGKAVHVLDVDVITINSKLVKITEEEYNELMSNKGKCSQEQQSDTANTADLNNSNDSVEQQEDSLQTNTDEACAAEQTQQTEQEQQGEQEQQDDNSQEQTSDEQEAAQQEAFEQEQQDDTNVSSQNIQTVNELPQLEAEVERLKKLWEQANRPKRKETLQKQIKAIQEKINKLK